MEFSFLLKFAAVSLASSGLAVFIAKRWIEHSFGARLAKIEAENRLREHEHKIRFTRYDEKVTSAIEGAYEIVCEYSDAARLLVAESHLEDERLKTLYQEVEAVAKRFDQYMRRQSIYLPENMADELLRTRGLLREEFGASLEKMSMSKAREKSILFSVYEEARLKKEFDALMHGLQKMIRKHLQQFEADLN